MFERFTETARRIIREAHEEAQRRRHRSVNAEHLFWAMLRQRDGMALVVLDRLGVQRSAVIEELELALSNVRPADKRVIEIPFDREAVQALERSIQQARDLEGNWVGTEALLLGLLHDEHAQVARILDAHGANFETALAMVLDLLGKPSGPEPKHPSPHE